MATLLSLMVLKLIEINSKVHSGSSLKTIPCKMAALQSVMVLNLSEINSNVHSGSSLKTIPCKLAVLQSVMVLTNPCLWAAIVRYLKSDGKLASVTFNNLLLADGRSHGVMFHLSGLRKGTPKMDLYVDCKLAQTLGDVPMAFRGLPPGGNTVELRTMPKRPRVSQGLTD